MPAWSRGADLSLLEHARRLKRMHPDWHLPEEITDQEWRKALIFVRVVDTLVDALSVEPESLRRDSRLVQDLGAW